MARRWVVYEVSSPRKTPSQGLGCGDDSVRLSCRGEGDVRWRVGYRQRGRREVAIWIRSFTCDLAGLGLSVRLPLRYRRVTDAQPLFFFVFQSNPHGFQNLAQANDWRVPEKSLQQLMFVLTCLYFCSVLIHWTTDQPYSELSRFLLSKRQTNITTLVEAPICESVVTTPAPPTIYIITTNTTTTNKSSTNTATNNTPNTKPSHQYHLLHQR